MWILIISFMALLACGRSGETHSAASPHSIVRETPAPVVPTVPPPALAIADFPGITSTWEGYIRHDFQVGDQTLMVIEPTTPAPGRPWIWFGEFFDVTIDLDKSFLDKGFYLVHLFIPNRYGSPRAVAYMDSAYNELVSKYGMNKKPTLAGYSRGTLYAYNWAEAHPDKVSSLYGVSSDFDFRIWPGGYGMEHREPVEWTQLLAEYGFASDIEAVMYGDGPLYHLAPLAAAGVPILHFCGDSDVTVPCNESSAIATDKYKKLGGDATLVTIPGGTHDLYTSADVPTILDFVVKNAH